MGKQRVNESRRSKKLGDILERQFPKESSDVQQLIQERAYLKWQARHGNTTVTQEETENIWLEAEKEINEELESR